MIGGMVGTGCSGTNAAAYGTMKDWVLSLTVVLADGTVIKTRQRARKSSAGYDLTRTFIGSEGTLGMVTEAVLKLAVKPRCEVVAVCIFPSVHKAASAVQSIVSRGLQVAAVEILDEVQMRSINEARATTRIWKEEPSLFFKFNGSSDVAVNDTAKLVSEITQQHGSSSFIFASSPAEREELWSARKAALWSMLALRKSSTDKVWITDVAVPLSRLADIIEKTKADILQSGLVMALEPQAYILAFLYLALLCSSLFSLQRHHTTILYNRENHIHSSLLKHLRPSAEAVIGLLGSIVGHVGDGNFHTLILHSDEQRHIAEGLVHRMDNMAIEMKGTITGEHGVGFVKRDYLESELGKTTVDTMRMVSLSYPETI